MGMEIIESHLINSAVVSGFYGDDEYSIETLWIDKDHTLWTVEPTEYEIEQYNIRPVKGVIV